MGVDVVFRSIRWDSNTNYKGMFVICYKDVDVVEFLPMISENGLTAKYSIKIPSSKVDEIFMAIQEMRDKNYCW